MSLADTIYTAESHVPAEAFGPFEQRGFDLLQLETEQEAFLDSVRADEVAAEATEDAPTIAMCRERREQAEALCATFEQSKAAMIEGEATYGSAVARVRRAWMARAAGTLDPDVAIELEAEVIRASAAERFYRATLPALRSAVTGAANKLRKMRTGEIANARAAAMYSTEAIVRWLSSEFSAAQARQLALNSGKASTSMEAAWWVFCEAVARRAFEARAEERSKDPAARRRSPEGNVTLADLDECFAARRAGLAAAKRQALAKAEELRSFAEAP